MSTEAGSRAAARNYHRGHPRIATNLPIRITAMSIKGKQLSSDAVIVNVSRGGAQLELDFETDNDTPITIHWEDSRGKHAVVAQLRWKRRAQNNWQIGVEMSTERRLWNDLMYLACRR